LKIEDIVNFEKELKENETMGAMIRLNFGQLLITFDITIYKFVVKDSKNWEVDKQMYHTHDDGDIEVIGQLK